MEREVRHAELTRPFERCQFSVRYGCEEFVMCCVRAVASENGGHNFEDVKKTAHRKLFKSVQKYEVRKRVIGDNLLMVL